ncbi:energy transducer TonB [Tenacibaculum aestuariivivum]|uniref:energy transducer TonB n=1 Tax=Tenacibaculum aestuariivivum TaxID=2006131 RepID=UPI003AB59E82
MKNKALIFLTILLTITSVKSQEIKNAKYLNGDITKILLKNSEYPIKDLNNKIQGDVILSFIINKEGEKDSLTIVSSPSKSLSLNSLISFDKLENKWSPYKVNEIPISKKHLVIYRYRYYIDTTPPEYEKKAKKMVKKQKFKKALKLFNKAIKNNPFDYQVFESRSKVKEKLGNDKGAITDGEKALKLKTEVISIVNVNIFGKTRTVKRIVRY